LSGALTGARRFGDVLSVGQTCPYCIVAVDSNGNPSGDWEVGTGTYSAANTLTRTAVEASSNSNSAVSFAAGTKRVSLDATAAYLAGAYRSGGTDVAVADGGTGASTASAARTNLELGTIATEDEATAAQIQAGTASKAVAADKLIAAAAPQTLTDGATIAWDMAAGFNAKVTLGDNRTLGTPTNPHVGLTYVLEVIQDATGSRTMTWPASFNWGSAGTPTLSTAASKVDIITLYCRDAATPKFRAVFNKDS
jgi:hypothetical protein